MYLYSLILFMSTIHHSQYHLLPSSWYTVQHPACFSFSTPAHPCPLLLSSYIPGLLYCVHVCAFVVFFGSILCLCSPDPWLIGCPVLASSCLFCLSLCFPPYLSCSLLLSLKFRCGGEVKNKREMIDWREMGVKVVYRISLQKIVEQIHVVDVGSVEAMPYLGAWVISVKVFDGKQLNESPHYLRV